MTLLSACVHEAARLRPAAAFSVAQSCPHDRIIDGFLIPAGTNLVVDSFSLNISNEFWGRDSNEYRPERFIERGTTTDMRYHFWRFGFGPRQCLGRYMADLIIRATLVHMVNNFEMVLDDRESDIDSNPEVWISHPQAVLRYVKR
jgi:cytochrome P450